MRCGKCKFDNPGEFKFCGQCGATLKVESEFSYSNDDYQIELRQVTIIFCDLVESTILSENLGHEELREVIGRYQEICERVVHRFEGHIDYYMGDGVLIYFGYPRKYEDDAQRAVYAALDIIAQVRAINNALKLLIKPLGGQTLRVRAGIHTGTLLVGDKDRSDKHHELVLGESINVAAKVQLEAGPNELVVTEDTFKLIQGYFLFKEIGPRKLKGVSKPVTLYQVLEPVYGKSRFRLQSGKELTPFVGRDHEVIYLHRKLTEFYENGDGTVFLIRGEAGIGKSRLIEEILSNEVCKDSNNIVLQCLSLYKNSSLHPVIDFLDRVLGLTEGATDKIKTSRIEDFLDQYGLYLTEAVPLIASLIYPATDTGYPPLLLSPQKLREKMLDCLIQIFAGLSNVSPTILVVEDLHWADPTTVEFLKLILSRLSNLHLFCIFSFREEFNNPWAGELWINDIKLKGLNVDQSIKMIRNIAKGESVPEKLEKRLLDTANGVPLFIEEITKSVIESGQCNKSIKGESSTPGIEDIVIPNSLQDTLVSRLDKYSGKKEIIQIASVFGSSFNFKLLQSIVSLEPSVINSELERLIQSDLLRENHYSSIPEYEFKHALIREATYNSILKTKRRQYHRRIAQVLEEDFLEIVRNRPELIASHYTEAGIKNKAIIYWQKAGQNSIEKAAYNEGINQLREGLSLIENIPESADKSGSEVALRITLGGALIDTKGYAVPEIEEHYSKALKLCNDLGGMGDSAQIIMVLTGLWLYYSFSGRLGISLEIAQEMLRTAEAEGASFQMVTSLQALGLSYMWMGEFTKALEQFKKVRSIYKSSPGVSFIKHTADPVVASIASGVTVLTILGYPREAWIWRDEAIQMANRLLHPYNIAVAKSLGSWFYFLTGEIDTLRAISKNDAEYAGTQGFPLFMAANSMWHGYSDYICNGDIAGIREFEDGYNLWDFIGTKLYSPYNYTLKAILQQRAGDIQNALSLIERAIEQIDSSMERWFEAEVYRIKGELLITENNENMEEALKCLEKSLEIARNQEANLFELKSAISLTQLLRKQGRISDAKHHLQIAVNHFGQDSDFLDLNVGRNLLNQVN